MAWRYLQASQIELYHATSLKNFLRIVEQGALIPQGGSGAGLGRNFNDDFDDHTVVKRLRKNFAGYVFLATNLLTALSYENTEDVTIILSIFMKDDNLLPDDNDCPTCKTWQDSANNIGQVKVEGKIPATDFNTVYIYLERTRMAAISYIDWSDKWVEYAHSLLSNEDWLPGVDTPLSAFTTWLEDQGYDSTQEVFTNEDALFVTLAYERLVLNNPTNDNTSYITLAADNVTGELTLYLNEPNIETDCWVRNNNTWEMYNGYDLTEAYRRRPELYDELMTLLGPELIAGLGTPP